LIKYRQIISKLYSNSLKYRQIISKLYSNLSTSNYLKIMLKFIAKPGINFPDERDTTPIIKRHIKT